MALIVKRAGSAEYGQYIKALVAADPGAGKTRQASTWPNPLYINIEGGLMSVADRAPLYVDVTSSADLEEVRRELLQHPTVREQRFGAPVDTAVIDTFDELSKVFMAERLRAEGKDTMAIADWGWLGDQLRGVLRGFRNLDMHVILNVHLKTKTDEETGAIFYQPAVQGAVGEEIAQFFDLAVLLRTKQESVPAANGNFDRVTRRYFQTFQDLKHPWVKDRSGQLPGEFKINFEDDFARLHDLVYANAPTNASGDVGTIGSAEAPATTVPDVPSNTRNQPPADPNQSTLAQGAGVAPDMLTAAAAKKEILAVLGDVTDANKETAKKIWGTRGSKQIDRVALEALKDEARVVSGQDPIYTTPEPDPVPDEAPIEVPADEPEPVEDAPAEPADLIEQIGDDVAAATEARTTPEEAPTEVPVELPDGMKHMPGCPKKQAACVFDDEITPLADLRFGVELCHECYAAELPAARTA